MTEKQKLNEIVDSEFMKPINSALDFLDLVLIPSSYFRHKDWKRLREAKSRNEILVHEIKIGAFELIRAASYIGAACYYFIDCRFTAQKVYDLLVIVKDASFYT